LKNLEYGASVEDVIENYRVTREQIQTVLEFAARSAAPRQPGRTRLAERMRVLFDKSALMSRPSPGRTRCFQQRGTVGTDWRNGASLTVAEEAGLRCS